VVRIDQPVERAERGEAGLVGAPCPVEDLAALHAGNRRGQPDANLHIR
jgi:hypothetical protein